MTDTGPVAEWWTNAIFYQVYPRSFADSDGDGVGDLGGVVAHLDHLSRLGVDAIWLNPVTVSPMADHGYDVADPRDVDPLFGGLDALELLIAEAHARGIRVTMDLVPNHTSSQHAWFQAALAAAPGQRRAGALHLPRRARPPEGRSAATRESTPARRPTTGCRCSADRPGPGSSSRRSRASGTCTCSTPNSPTSTGTTPRCSTTWRRRCGSGSTAVSTASASTSRTAWPSHPACRT